MIIAPRPSGPPTKCCAGLTDGVIDQRQQQIDPAGHHRSDVNAPAAGTMKQPGSTGPGVEGAAPGATPNHLQNHAGKEGNTPAAP